MAGRNHTRFVAASVIVAAFVFACIGLGRAFAQNTPAALKVASSSFTAGKSLPIEFTCEGGDYSPALSWSGVPAGAKTISLICEDPDAPGGTWTHWVLFNLPAATTSLAEKTPTSATLPGGARQGTNDFHRIGYSGPCPPPGKTHHYIFKVYALDFELDLKSGANRQELLHAISGHVIAQGQIIGTYER